MKFLVIAALALLVAVQATPYVPGSGRGGYGRGYGGGGGGGYGGGSEYGNSGYSRGENSHLNKGAGSHGFQEGHDISHSDSEFDKSVHQHHSSDHNRGGVSDVGEGSYLDTGYGGYDIGRDNYGRDYGHGYNYGV